MINFTPSLDDIFIILIILASFLACLSLYGYAIESEKSEKDDKDEESKYGVLYD